MPGVRKPAALMLAELIDLAERDRVVPASSPDDCPTCRGLGEVATGVDPQTGVALVADCPACRGTGVLPDLGGAA